MVEFTEKRTNGPNMKSDEFYIDLYSSDQNLFWKGRSWKALGRTTKSDVVTKLPNSMYTAQMNLA